MGKFGLETKCMIDEVRELGIYAKDLRLDFGIVYARPVNSRDPQAFYLVSDDGAFLYEPKFIGRSVEDAKTFIRQRAMMEACWREEESRPYYGG